MLHSSYTVLYRCIQQLIAIINSVPGLAGLYMKQKIIAKQFNIFSVSDSDDSQCDDDEIILSSEDDDKTLLQMSTAPFNSITDEETFRPFLWMNYPVDLQAISQDYFRITISNLVYL